METSQNKDVYTCISFLNVWQGLAVTVSSLDQQPPRDPGARQRSEWAQCVIRSLSTSACGTMRGFHPFFLLVYLFEIFKNLFHLIFNFLKFNLFEVFKKSSIIDLQGCANFCCTAKRFSYTFFSKFFSIMAYHKTLNMVSCATQQDLIYLFYIQQLTSVNLNICIESRLIGAKGEGLREGWSGAGGWSWQILLLYRLCTGLLQISLYKVSIQLI